MKRIIHIVFLLISLISLQMQGYGQDPTLPIVCGGSRVRYFTEGLPNSTFDWQIQGGVITANNNTTVDVQWDSIAGIKTLEVTEHSPYGCVSTPKTGYTLVSNPKLVINQVLSVCQGKTIDFDPNVSFSSYLWSNGSTSSKITVGDQGWYSLTVTDAYGCSTKDSVYLAVRDVPKINLLQSILNTPNYKESTTINFSDSSRNNYPTVTICKPVSYTIDAGSDGASYKWSNGYITQTVIMNEGRQNLWVEVENQYGCVASDTLRVLPCRETDITNAFTPNGDGDNDCWKPKGFEAGGSIEIFDRWGRLVFRNTSGQCWDGTGGGGRLLPMDSYYYVYKPADGSKKRVGNVTLIR